jgi:hypothetical protein
MDAHEIDEHEGWKWFLIRQFQGLNQMKLDSLFQYRCYNEHPSIKAQGEALFLEFQSQRKRKVIDKNDQNKQRRAFKVALAGMYFGKAFDQHGSFVRIPLNSNHYSGKTRISPIFQQELLAAFRWLIRNEYFELVQPAHQVEGRWTPAGYRLTKKWLRLAQETHEHDPLAVQLRTCRNRDVSFVELRDGKKSLRLTASGQKDFSIKLLKWYEETLFKHKFTIGSQELPLFPFSLTRIYSNRSYWAGGRFYSLFQSRKSQTRLHLKIDGESVCEVDYRFLHPALLHAEQGLELDYDPYEVPGFSRTIVKVAFQILINTQRPFPPTKSLVYFLNKGKRKQKNLNDPAWTDHKFDNAFCTQLAEAIAERNKPIAHHFSKGVGLRLQHTDSILVSAVLDFIRKEAPSTVVIPIHDSFVVKQSDLSVLLEALAYAEHTLAVVMNQELRIPTLKATVIKGFESVSYISMLKEHGLEGLEATYKEEDLVQELSSFLVDDEDDCESFEFDAGVEELSQ